MERKNISFVALSLFSPSSLFEPYFEWRLVNEGIVTLKLETLAKLTIVQVYPHVPIETSTDEEKNVVYFSVT